MKPRSAHILLLRNVCLSQTNHSRLILILENCENGGPEGTLYETLNRCVTPFGTRISIKVLNQPISSLTAGKRRMKKLVLQPLQSIDQINERLDAIDDLIQKPYLDGYSTNRVHTPLSPSESLHALLISLPDVDRMCSRVLRYGEIKLNSIH